jgi:ribokinase
MDLVITSPHYPRLGETVIGTSIARHPGGKGSNQAVAAQAAGTTTEFIGVVGKDETGRELRTFLEDRGVGVRHMGSIQGADSGLAMVVVAGGDNAVVVVSGANAHFGPERLADVPVGSHDVLVSQFEIAEATVHAFFERGRSAGARTVLNPSPTHAFSDELWDLSDVIVVNEIELQSISEMRGLTGSPERLLTEVGSLIGRDGQAIVVTLGAAGCLVVTHDDTVSIPGRAVDVVDTTGAGDCFLGFLAGRLVHDDDLFAAARLANLAASLCVQRMGAGSSMPTGDEVSAAASAPLRPGAQ